MANITFSEASGVNDSIYGKSQAPIRMMIQKRAEAFEAESIASKIFVSRKSNNWAEKYTSMTAMEGFRVVGENGAHPTDGMEEGFSKTIADLTWKNRFSISRKIIEDAKIGDLRKKPEAFVTAYYRTREKLGAALIGGAISGSTTIKFMDGEFDLTGADGQALFSASHPAKVKGAAQSNLFGDAFSDDALGKLATVMQNTRGDNDEILDVSPDTILIPNIHSLKKAVFAAVGSEADPETANNAFNYQFGRWNVIVWPYLNQFITAGTAPWVLMDSRYNETYDSLIWQDRIALDVNSFVDNNTNANVWDGYARFTAGFNDWRAIAVAGVSGADPLS
jgi:phage major head subunit gpT-like protein